MTATIVFQVPAYEEIDKSNPIDYYTFCFYKGEIQDQLSWT
jgi:hypothetical protein